MAPEYVITRHDPAEFTDQELAAGVRLYNTVEAEVWPEDPVTPVGDAIARSRAVPSTVGRTAFRAWSDGTLVGEVEVAVDSEHDDNPDLLTCQIIVRGEYRRQGVGTGLLERVTEFARSHGRRRLVGKTYSRVPDGAQFARRVGAVQKSESHTNHLPLAEVDRALLESWVRDGSQRAHGYELLSWDDTVPDEHLGAFLDLLLVMNDAPTDDLELNDFTISPGQWRDVQAQAAAVGQQRWFLVARRSSDGALAALHDLAWVPAFPQVMWIGSTGVRREDRGHALGKWLKASMTLRVLAERPGVSDIRTDNATSNEAMLSINHAMGYRPLFAIRHWELLVEKSQA